VVLLENWFGLILGQSVGVVVHIAIGLIVLVLLRCDAPLPSTFRGLGAKRSAKSTKKTVFVGISDCLVKNTRQSGAHMRAAPGAGF